MATQLEFENFFDLPHIGELGIEAFLPQNIPDEYLEIFLEEAEMFLQQDIDYFLPQERFSVLVNTVVLIESINTRRLAVNLSNEDLLKKTGIFANLVRLEGLRRLGVLDMDLPTLENIFDEDSEREVRMEVLPGGQGGLNYNN